MSSLALIGVPSSAGARRTGQELAPAAFRAARLTERLRGLGFDVLDEGDPPAVVYRPDSEHPRHQNADLVARVARQTADRVDRAVASGRAPLVLGGDCSVSLGVVAGLLRHHTRLGLLYFDGDVDLNTPETTESGIFDGMVMAHLLGRGAREVAGVGPRMPLLDEEDVVLFGYDEESGFIDPPEREALERSRMAKYPMARIRQDPAAAAREALSVPPEPLGRFPRPLRRRRDEISAADVHHPRGLDLGLAFAALQIFVAAPACAAIVVTELNAEKDPDGSQAALLVDGLTAALGARS